MFKSTQMVVWQGKAHVLGWVLLAEVDPRVEACSLPPVFARGVGSQPCRACAARLCRTSCSLVHALSIGKKKAIALGSCFPSVANQLWPCASFAVPRAD